MAKHYRVERHTIGWTGSRYDYTLYSGTSIELAKLSVETNREIIKDLNGNSKRGHPIDRYEIVIIEKEINNENNNS